MNLQTKEILQSTNKCILITLSNNDVLVTPCNYIFHDNYLTINFDCYNNALSNLINNNQATIYITVCDKENIYYLIVEGCAEVSSTSFCTPSINNINNQYLIKISIDNTVCYFERINN